ncbi:N-acetylmannosamine-6-phosphate 2-epimerase [Pseudobutyrivibrio sp.]|uniref:N-acetylmannosamine-6-phosphate 2-epimerase n=1 Tax=Pseudobutyrivibrio sp. TaxID=2014367 RepID=UPI0025FD2C12|nr:N-acetylmannosamine-6-phosphate 2-epimerase [Pseudobutyrivibrio sp.]MBR5648960.1 N-acetylmannosamine-6-phosphate 2-epimerase [Pseudobutyrivibrio sp.]
MDNYQIINKLKGGLIVSCQALEDEPLYSSFIMSKMALAAAEGGAVGIRANSVVDIAEIMKTTTLPIIGLIKKDYDDSEVYITPTEDEVDALVLVGADIIAMDATNRPRPNGETLDSFFKKIKDKYPNKLFMADCSTYEEGVHARELGFDIVSTTLAGYTAETKGRTLPDFDMLKKLVNTLDIPVIAEGGIWEPAQLKKAFDLGCHCAVVGSAITRPREITKHFIAAIKEN